MIVTRNNFFLSLFLTMKKKEEEGEKGGVTSYSTLSWLWCHNIRKPFTLFRIWCYVVIEERPKRGGAYILFSATKKYYYITMILKGHNSCCYYYLCVHTNKCCIK